MSGIALTPSLIIIAIAALMLFGPMLGELIGDLIDGIRRSIISLTPGHRAKMKARKLPIR